MSTFADIRTQRVKLPPNLFSPWRVHVHPVKPLAMSLDVRWPYWQRTYEKTTRKWTRWTPRGRCLHTTCVIVTIDYYACRRLFMNNLLSIAMTW